MHIKGIFYFNIVKPNYILFNKCALFVKYHMYEFYIMKKIIFYSPILVGSYSVLWIDTDPYKSTLKTVLSMQ